MNTTYYSPRSPPSDWHPDNTDVAHLLFEAQLNIIADNLTPVDYIIPTMDIPTIFLGEYPPLTAWGDLKPATRDLATYDPLWTRLVMENNWTTEAFLHI